MGLLLCDQKAYSKSADGVEFIIAFSAPHLGLLYFFFLKDMYTPLDHLQQKHDIISSTQSCTASCDLCYAKLLAPCFQHDEDN
jgi:hypothetical protein